MMFQNPIVQTVMLFFGSYTCLTMLKKFGPAGQILTVFAGVTAVIIWMLRYNRPQLHGAYQNPVAKPVIDLVCTMTKDQPPVDATVDGGYTTSTASVAPTPARPRQTVSARSFQDTTPASNGASGASTGAAQSPQQGESGKLLVRRPEEFREMSYQLRQQILGHDEVIHETVRLLQRSIELREQSSVHATQPPLGMFLFFGRAGLGKRSLAIEIAQRLYAGDCVGVLDFADPTASIQDVVSAVRANPYQTLVLDNINAASRQAQSDLMAAFAGQPLIDAASGARVSFRHCFFFLLVNRGAEAFPRPQRSQAGTGMTVVVEHLVQATGLDDMLALSLQGAYPFHLPDEETRLRIVALLMERECRKYKLSLGAVSPVILAREVEEVSKLQSFRATPARISKILSDAIRTAINSGAETVSVGEFR